MASSYNRVVLVGRLGRDPELRYTQAATPVANFPVATDERFTDREGNRQQRTEWHRVIVWNKQAETVSNYITKGRLVLVEGSLQTRKWQDRQGQDRFTTEIRAQRVVFLDPKSKDTGNVSQGNESTEAKEGGADPFDLRQEGTDNLGPAFPSEASSIDDAPF